MLLRTSLLAILSLLFTANLHAQAPADTSLWSMIQQGGWAMYPLALCSLAFLYIAIHCYRETSLTNFAPSPQVQQLAHHFANCELETAHQTAQASDTILARTLSRALPKLAPYSGPQDLELFETEMGNALSDEQSAISQWTHYLSVVANVAPMIGLLGTVSGMIGGFQTMASGGMGRPELFAGDIGEALITTATGLCIGIPAMVAHSIFNNRLQSAINETTRHANHLLDQLPKQQTAS
ncbi:MotA/TolQ/ExbB proton channel family protein [Pelagicoccus mobilis]|uniref:MotA/TolQ/ExbB proton channel family protein n=1 Tax=Pelagicoccus mobilis TaxID=415221 RepID=A0A934S7I8_9BACT|nr:MotA/TolQ/ExbB proton channel family protein [Pelagicoccus mobilis]MBK1880338.1 MotA/TolQ/ExbB proton channel family protein [Pelagicoccus mobilis]